MSRHALTWLAIFVVIALMFLRLPQMAAKQDALLHTYGALVEVDALARQKFVEPVERGRLVDGAIRGMMFQLDPYSGYIAPNQLAAFMRRNRGEYIGIGVELGIDAGRITVVAPIEGSPAATAGLRPGDVLLAVDGQDVDGLSVFDVEERLTGTPGSTVRLRVRHPQQHDPEAITIERGPVSLVTVRGFRRDRSGRWEYLIDPGHRIGYIRVSSFLDHTMRDLDAALSKLAQRGAEGLIVDLRFNPGGIMHQAIDFVDRFVSEGLIVATVTRRRAVREYWATRTGTVTNLTLAVLINGGSASAAEIVAGALQDHHRALIVGARSFGKGSVQQVIPLTEHDAAVKLTTAYYELPSGRIIHRTDANARTHAWGVTPDVPVPLTEAENHAIQAARRALDVACARWETSPADSRPDAPRNAVDPPCPYEIDRDRQLLEALARLKPTSRG